MRCLHLLFGPFSCLLMACGGSRIDGQTIRMDHPVNCIAISPGSSEIGHGIEQGLVDSELYRGKIVGSDAAVNLLHELGIRSPKATLPENLARLNERGVDAWLRVEASNAVLSDAPKTVLVRMASTHSPDQSIEFVWHNAWGGMPGSPADYMMKAGAFKAGKSIAEELARILAEKQEVPQP